MSERLEKFHALWSRGASRAEITANLAIGATTISRIRRELGLPARAVYAPPWSEERKAVFCRQWRDGVSAKAIAMDFGIGVSAVDRMRRKLALPLRRNGTNKHRIIFFLSEDLHKAMTRAAFGRYATNADYLRGLIRRDTGAQA